MAKRVIRLANYANSPSELVWSNVVRRANNKRLTNSPSELVAPIFDPFVIR
jgi:hypothetical protein